jgi:nucleoside-diphosphate-sugar epimerase
VDSERCIEIESLGSKSAFASGNWIKLLFTSTKRWTESSSARLMRGSMAQISFRPCRRIFTVPGIISTCRLSHVLPALIRKVHEAKTQNRREVVIWGTGTPRREFLHTRDLADALRFLLENYDSPQIINVGCGYDITVRELALLVAKVVGVDAELVFDTSKPDGTPRKLLDISRLRQLGWQPRISLEDGVRDTYQWFLRNLGEPVLAKLS